MAVFQAHTEDLSGMKKFRWRFIVYLIAVLYLAGDLYLFEGPLRSRLGRAAGSGEAAAALARREGIVATVNGHPIRREELDRAVGEYCLKRGLSAKEVSGKRMNSIRVLVINELVVDRLIWFHSQYTAAQSSSLELAEATARFRRAIPGSPAGEESLAVQGFSPERLEKFLQNQAIQRAWIEKIIASYIVVSEQEIRQRYEEEPEVSTVAERIQARHIFIARLGKDAGRAEAVIRAAARRLDTGESFDRIAGELSEDPRTKSRGGNLGWFTRGRMDKDFAAAVFAISEGEVGQPFATDLGWHLVEVTARKPAARVSIEAVRAELAAAIEAEKRQAAVEALISYLKSRAKIRYFPDFIWVE